MNEIVNHQMLEVLTDPRVGWSTVLINWLSVNISNIATIISIVLSVVVLISHIVKFIYNRHMNKINEETRQSIESARIREEIMAVAKHELEMELLKERLELLRKSGIDGED